MPRFRKKPVEVEAMRLTADNVKDVCDWIHGEQYRARTSDEGDEVSYLVDPLAVLIDTLEGTMRADEGDWIIRGVAHEFYPCKPDIFDQTYEPVEATS